MPEINRKPVSRKRDIVEDDLDLFETYEPEEDDIDTAKAKRPQSRVVKRRNYDEDDEVSETDEEEEVPASPSKPAASSNKSVFAGFAGVERIRRIGNNGGITRLVLTGDPQLIKFLEPEPFGNFRQHWVPQGAGQGDRPWTCCAPSGADCPLCDIGNPGSATIAWNVLHLSETEAPSVKVFQIGIRAERALEEAARDRSNDEVLVTRDFWAVNRSGKGQQSQTNFRPVKQRDLEDDWSDVLNHFDIADLSSIIKKAKQECYGLDIFPDHTTKQLMDAARILASLED